MAEYLLSNACKEFSYDSVGISHVEAPAAPEPLH